MRSSAVLILLGAIASSCGGTGGLVAEADVAPSDDDRVSWELQLDFERAAEVGSVLPGATNLGTARVTIDVLTLEGGRVVLEAGSADGRAARFPAITAGPRSPAAVIAVTSAESDDPLQPGDRAFRFGADFMLDRESTGDTGQDDGNNLIQRGLFADRSQYKIQVDDGIPACRVTGTSGEAVVKAPAPVEPDRWYRVMCERSEGRVTLSLTSLIEAGRTSRRSVEVSVGKIDFDHPGTPLSIGGKSLVGGYLVASSTDQFNGTIDNVTFELLGGDPGP